MNKRYQKVLALYSLSTLLPALLIKHNDEKKTAQYVTKTAIGYSIFAYGLKALTRRKKQMQA